MDELENLNEYCLYRRIREAVGLPAPSEEKRLEEIEARWEVKMDKDCACTKCLCRNQAWGGGICRECAAGSHNGGE